MKEIDFWRYADGVKQSAIVGVVEQFSTREPTHVTLMRIFRILGTELSYLVRADEGYHLFLNPELNEAHILRCQDNERYENKKLGIRILLDDHDSLSWYYFADESASLTDECWDEVKPATQLSNLWEILEKPAFFALAPFCQRDIPLGYFVFVWRNPDSLPYLFKQEGAIIRESAVTTLNFLQGLVTKLVTNHHTLYRDTYLPTFMQPMPRRVAILFADIRNFTSAFEAMRLHIPGKDISPNPLVGLLKAYLAAASQIIAQPGIGRIDKFIGDGIMATFGEYLSCKATDGRTSEENQSIVSCLLAIYSGAILIDAFKKLFNHFLNLDSIKSFMLEYNERFDLKIGIGISFGEATFDYFGTSMLVDEDSSRLIGGYLEFTAVGDNVNIAQRLESIASKPVSEVSVFERGQSRSKRSPNHIAPIILGRTAFLRIQGGLIRPTSDTDGMSLAQHYRSTVALKGRGGVAEVYEIHPNEIGGDFLLRTLSFLGLNRLEHSIKQYWNETEGVFEFSDQRAKELIEKYC